MNQDKINKRLLALVEKYHYDNPNYKRNPNAIIIYNVCPLCGSVDLIELREADAQSKSGFFILRNINNCNTCNTMKVLHPQVFAWMCKIYDTAQFIKSLSEKDNDLDNEFPPLIDVPDDKIQ